MKVELVVAWYDMWIGAYYDRKHRWLYLMIPLIGIRIRRRPKRRELTDIKVLGVSLLPKECFTEEELESRKKHFSKSSYTKPGVTPDGQKMLRHYNDKRELIGIELLLDEENDK